MDSRAPILPEATPARALASHDYTRIVHWAECDAANIIFFATYARWISEGLDHLMIALGIPHGGATTPGRRLGLPAVSTLFEYKTPAFLYDEVTHRIAVTAVGRKSLKFEHTVARGQTLLMRAEDTRVMAEYSPETGDFASIEIPAEFRKRLGA